MIAETPTMDGYTRAEIAARYEDAKARCRELLARALAAEAELARVHAAQAPRSAALANVLAEADRATALHGSYASSHEAYAVLLEELDELWEEIKANSGRDRIVAELTQVAGVAVRWLEQIHAHELAKEGG